MRDKEAIFELIDGLSGYVAQAKVELGETADSYRALAANADAAAVDADEAYDELGKLLDSIESGEVPIDEDTARALEDLIDMGKYVLQDISGLHALHASIEKASTVLTNSASTQQDVIGLSQELR